MFTPVNIRKFHDLLRASHYDEKETQFLEDGIQNGFSLEYDRPTGVQCTAPNLKLHVGDEIDLWNKVMKEVKLGQYAGPYKMIPFDNYIQSPIGLVPKDNGINTRLIFHLSYPRNGKTPSVNGHTPRHL